MPFYGASIAMQYLELYRVCYIGGRPGSGKTSLAFRMAYELYKRGFVRYIISNCRSVWSEPLERVVLRDGKFVDACIVLDEAGLFMQSGKDADKFLAFLRKLNVVLIMPSVSKPAAKVQAVTVQRLFNYQVAGLPLWSYRMDLMSGRIEESTSFYWLHPSEIFGVYDTGGFPADDAQIAEYQNKWTLQAAATYGYKAPTRSGVFQVAAASPETAGGLPATDDQQAGVLLGEIVGELRGVAQAIEEGTQEQSSAISILAKAGRKRRK